MTCTLKINDGRIRLLMTGDLHLGRSSSRVPEQIRREELRATTLWKRMVDLALSKRVSLVCLSGDIADQDNKFWEAIGPLEQGIKRLTEAGIPTVAVAGNHDFQVLMRLADQLPPEHFYLLGRGGAWERLALKQEDKIALHIDGWSFPTKHVHTNPVADYDFQREASIPTLGMIHGDLYATTSDYAPLDLSGLQDCAVDGWLLGHLHAPRVHTSPGKPWVFYPGSSQAFDPGETGAHGPWMVEMDQSGLAKPEQWPLSSVWYDNIQIDLSGVKDISDCDDRVLGAIREVATDRIKKAGPHCRYVSLRLRLTGETVISGEIESHTNDMVEGLELTIGEVLVGIDKIVVETLPAIDLNDYSSQTSAPGAVTRLLLELDCDEVSNEVADLIQRTGLQLKQRASERSFTVIDPTDITDEVVRDHLRVQGRAFLSQLVQQ
jgi:exonuclease SbcD